MTHQDYLECIDACNRCVVASAHCATACLQEENVQALRRCIQLDHDCMDICQLAIRYMARKSEYTERICQLCAEVCETCAQECRRHDMDHCQKCADACMECANKCREMAGLPVGQRS